MSWKTLDRMQLMGKRVLTRVDINVPVENGRVTPTPRVLIGSYRPCSIY